MDAPEAQIKVKLLPRSSRNEILGRDGDIFRIKVTSPPIDGKANKALIEFLAGKLGIPKGNVGIQSGKKARLKTIRIEGLDFGDIQRRLGEQT